MGPLPAPSSWGGFRRDPTVPSPSSRTDPSEAHIGAGRPGAANLHNQAEGLPLEGRVPWSSEPLCQALALDGTFLGTKGPLWGPVHPRKVPSAPISSLEFSKALSAHSGQRGTLCARGGGAPTKVTPNPSSSPGPCRAVGQSGF